ncbi:MAG: gamma-glutamyl-gamma-aminobutyrate hydrolase family protein [Kouleothrix sp.]|jgi:putative glutamine amidotransferase|nr:gamma-glutamyl-gamma-aminobutyrate hydrolase family protein [Kouleothrix sp.]
MSNRPAGRPIIGIPCSSYPDSWFTPANGNAISYLRALEAAGGIPALIHQTRDAEVLDAHYQRCDALLFAGGEDVGPAHYAAAPHPQLGPINPVQDENEIALARRAVADGKPLLGICRGVQLLNVALGGTLYQDLPSERPDGLNHSASTEQHDMSFLAHPLALTNGCWLAEQLGAHELLVNSLHHQALHTIAPGLRVVGRAPDGVVEAVEGIGPGFVLGVQCHPEELWERADPRWARVFAGFVALAGRV